MASQLDSVNNSLVHVGLVQAGLMAVSLAIMFSLYAMLRRRERRLEQEKTLAKSYFFSTVSHDIRTPLNAIVGFSEMLKAGFETEAEREQALDSILVSGRTLLGLINDVLDLSKLESGKMQIALEPTECPRLLRGVMDAFRISGKKPGLELRCEIGEMPALMLDPQRLRQIVFNLVGNAVKFTEKGHVTLRANYVRLKDAEKGVFRLSVEDTGCGITEEDQKRICSAYVQVGAKLARNGGTGLGLAICSQLVKAMGGELKVKSALGKGSTFEIVLPGVRATVLAETPAPAASGRTADKTSAASSHPVHRILLVDDSKMNLMVLKALLKKAGNYETTLAMDGQEALKLVLFTLLEKEDVQLLLYLLLTLDGKEFKLLAGCGGQAAEDGVLLRLDLVHLKLQGGDEVVDGPVHGEFVHLKAFVQILHVRVVIAGEVQGTVTLEERGIIFADLRFNVGAGKAGVRRHQVVHVGRIVNELLDHLGDR